MKYSYRSLLLIFFLIAPQSGTVVAQFERPDVVRKEALALWQKADTLFEHENYSSALEGYQQALDKLQLIGDRENEARLRDSLGDRYYSLQEYDKVLEQRESALQLFIDLECFAEAATTAKKIAYVWHDNWQYTEARRFYGQSRSLAEMAQDTAQVASAELNIGLTYADERDYKKAVPHYQNSLGLRRLMRDNVGQIRVLNNIGIAKENQGYYKEALNVYSEAIEIAQEIESLSYESLVLGNLAGLYQTLTNYPEALEAYARCLILRQTLEDSIGIARIYDRIGSVYAALGDDRKAMGFHLTGQRIAKSIGALTVEAEALNNIGVAYINLGGYRKAMEYLDPALSIFEQTRDLAGMDDCLHNLGIAYTGIDEYSRAEEYFKRDLELLQSTGSEMDLSLTFYAIGRFLIASQRYKAATDTLKRALLLGKKYHSPYDQALAHYGMGLCYEAQADHEAAISHFKEAIEFTENVRGVLSGVSLKQSFSAGSSTAYDGIIAALTKVDRTTEALEYAEKGRARTFLDLLGAGKIELHQESIDDQYNLDLLVRANVHPLSLPEIRSYLRENQSLLVYYLTDDAVLIWVIDHTGCSFHREAVPREQIEHSVRGLRDAIVNGGLVEARAKVLYKKLFLPIADMIKGTDLLIIPHQTLHYLPFQVLRDADDRLLLERFTISYLPAASILKFQQIQTDNPERTFLGIGNPKIADPTIPDLPNAVDEVNTIAGLFDHHQVLLREQATENRIKQATRQYNTLHFACHCDLNPAYPLHSSLLLAPTQDNDGRLKIHELYDLQIDADLVTLSACQTVLGKLTSGDDLVSLARGFMAAGASTVIATLWRIEDEQSAHVIERFYENLMSMDKVDALRAAQLETIQTHPEPANWAPFILIGNPY